jgi:hypothetical protein
LDLANAPRWHRVVRAPALSAASASAAVHMSHAPRGAVRVLFADVSSQVVQGEGPGARYAHVLALVGQRFLLVLGGNDGYKVRAPSATRLCYSN